MEVVVSEYDGLGFLPLDSNARIVVYEYYDDDDIGYGLLDARDTGIGSRLVRNAVLISGGMLMLWYVYHYLSTKWKYRKRPQDEKMNKNCREQARQAAIHRQQQTPPDEQRKKKKKKVIKRVLKLPKRDNAQNYSSLEKKRNHQSIQNHTKSTITKEQESYCAEGSLPVFDDGITSFHHLAHLENEHVAASMLQQLAKEFMPIIRRRGYNIRTVSEMCCCGDGIDYELGGHLRRLQKGQKVDGYEQEECGGYNRTKFLVRGKTVHSIHLRMRVAENHDYLYDYSELVDTMCHELSHCVHQNHDEPFWDLMAEIKREHSLLTDSHELPQDYASAVQQPFGDFDIYQSSTGRLNSS